MTKSAFEFVRIEEPVEAIEEKQGSHGEGSDAEEGEEHVPDELGGGKGEEEEDENGKIIGQHGTDQWKLQRQMTAEARREGRVAMAMAMAMEAEEEREREERMKIYNIDTRD
jgi:hypothetical protein